MPVSESYCAEVARAIAKLKRRRVRETSGRHSDDVPSFVYVMYVDGADHRLKVGISSDVRSRVSSLGHATGLALKLFCTFECPSRDLAFLVEKRFFRLANPHQIEGEFFKMAPHEAAQTVCSAYRSVLSDLDLGSMTVTEIVAQSGILAWA